MEKLGHLLSRPSPQACGAAQTGKVGPVLGGVHDTPGAAHARMGSVVRSAAYPRAIGKSRDGKNRVGSFWTRLVLVHLSVGEPVADGCGCLTR